MFYDFDKSADNSFWQILPQVGDWTYPVRDQRDLHNDYFKVKTWKNETASGIPSFSKLLYPAWISEVVSDDKKTVTIFANFVGYSKDEIKVTLTDGKLEIRGTTQNETKASFVEKSKYWTVEIPKEATITSAKFENSILTLVYAKNEIVPEVKVITIQ